MIYTRFHASMLSSTMVFCVVEKTSLVINFYISCCTLSGRRSVFGMDWLWWDGDHWVLCWRHALYEYEVSIGVLGLCLSRKWQHKARKQYITNEKKMQIQNVGSQNIKNLNVKFFQKQVPIIFVIPPLLTLSSTDRANLSLSKVVDFISCSELFPVRLYMKHLWPRCRVEVSENIRTEQRCFRVGGKYQFWWALFHS